MNIKTPRKILFILTTLLISGCFDNGNGGGSGGGKSEKNKITKTPTIENNKINNEQPQQNKRSMSPPLIMVAQTHLIPTNGLRWNETKINPELTISSNRETLVTVQFNEKNINNPRLQAWSNTELSATIQLNPPEQTPATEGGDLPPAENMWHAHIPAELVQPGLSLSVISENYTSTPNQEIITGPETEITINILPILLFGATESNTGKKFEEERTLSLNENLMQEAAAGLPVTRAIFKNHPAKYFSSDFLIIPPKNGIAASVAYSTSDVEGTGVIDTVNHIVSALHKSSGDENLNVVTYGSILALNNSKIGNNKLEWIGRGVSYTGSGAATSGNGGSKYGFLWHEGGHAMSLGHSRGEYAENWYPYEGGSIKGSSLNYNSYHKSFRSNLIPATSVIFNSCRNTGEYQKDADGRCYRQDPMDNADGGSAQGYNFPIFSDYNSARIQSWAKNRKKIDILSPTNFSRWDSTSNKWTAHTPTTQGFGDWAINENLPIVFNEPVVRINVNFSKAGTANVSRFYPPMYSIENSIKIFDALDPNDMDSIYPDTRANGTNPPYKWYCHISGCDYTVRVTFSDGTIKYRILKGGFRKKSYPNDFDDGVNDPLLAKSFKFWSMNVPRPNGTTVKKLELLDTPKAWSMSQNEIIESAALISETY
jgi:hypothetical protein